jgi:hypothetical protein
MASEERGRPSRSWAERAAAKVAHAQETLAAEVSSSPVR